MYAFVFNSGANATDNLGRWITGMEIRHGGSATISDDDYLDLKLAYDEYFDTVIVGNLGFRHKLVPKHKWYDPTTGWVDRPARTVAGFKYEYVVHSACSPASGRAGVHITQTITGFKWFSRKKNGGWGHHSPRDWKWPGYEDGPRLQRRIDEVTYAAGDMPRDILDADDKLDPS